MEERNFLKNSQIIILGICIAVAVIVSSVILSGGFLKVMKFTREQINVTGSATKEIRSDYIIWTGTFTRRAADLKTAYKLLEEDLDKVKKYLAAKGVDEKEIAISKAKKSTAGKSKSAK